SVRGDLVEPAVAEAGDDETAVGPAAEAVRISDTAAEQLRLPVDVNPGHAAARVGCPYALPVYPHTFRTLESVSVGDEVACSQLERRNRHVILQGGQRFVGGVSACA